MRIRDLVTEKFEQTLWELLQEKPINKVTVDEIVDRSGFSKRTFYNHFRDKNDLMSSIWQREYRMCWYEDDKPLTFPDFLVKYHRREFEIYGFLNNTLPYAGQNNLWETVQRTVVECLVDYIKRCGYGDAIDDDLLKFIEFYAHGVNGMAQSMFTETSVKHLRAYDLTPENRTDYEIRFIPEELKPYLLAEPKR